MCTDNAGHLVGVHRILKFCITVNKRGFREYNKIAIGNSHRVVRRPSLEPFVRSPGMDQISLGVENFDFL